MKKLIVKISIVLVLFIGKSGICQQNDSLPNIILIYMDDMGYGDVEAYGGIEYNTPNINELAAEGMRFTNFYAAQPICSASRAAILTGCYPNRIGLAGALMPKSKIGINQNEITIAELLKQKNYATSIVGKWHLGDADKFLPLRHGFDEYFGLPYSNDMWPEHPNKNFNFPPLPLIENDTVKQFIKDMDDQAMLTTWYTEKAKDFIKENQHRPFFLYLAHSMVHVPIAASEKFKGKSGQGLFGDVMMEIDWSVGEIMKSLKNNGLEKNTLVIFTSDNGPWLTYGNHAGSAGGLREGKATTWDGGQKVPSIFWWPGHIPAGTLCNKLAANIDILPTLSAITNTSLPKNKIDGVNILPLLEGETDANPRDHLLYYYHENSLEAVRMGQWKLVLPHDYLSYEGELPGLDGLPGKKHKATTPLALYNLRRDPGERSDVQFQHPDIIEQIMKIVEEARKDLGDDLTNREGKNRRPVGMVAEKAK